MVERSKVFRDRAKNNANNSNGWTFSCIIRYIQHQKERAERKEITAGAVKNYFQVIKLYCEMSDISLPWKRISRGLPKSRKSANDRAPTIEEISKIIEYPDRRISHYLNYGFIWYSCWCMGLPEMETHYPNTK
jgi:hypothetical protein